MKPTLPIDEALPELLARLAETPNVVLQAPPGAGKTTRVPLALLDAPWARAGRIVMLEPRRIAARAAAERMAASLGEKTGATVGYRIRGDAKISARTRIEVVTEGILTRRLQSDPGLDGVAAVVFDEFHERSIHADLGLAFCLEAQSALREDLRLIVMSATLDGEAVAALIGHDGAAPIVTSEGRSFPVETRWLETPWRRPADRKGPRFETVVADLTRRAMASEAGDALVFLPGAGEIRATARALSDRLDRDVDMRPIYGALPFADQQAAIRPSPKGRRKIVLATAIAETSLTIEGVRIVVDGGRSRRARFDPASGMSRLVTERVSRAAAAQRRGRAGRVEPGVCYRLWTKGEEGALAAFDPPEILEADLAPLALELAQWGADADDLAFLDAPPEAALAQARTLLRDLGALDADGRVTAHGAAIAAAPLHPRLAHMVLVAGASDQSCRLAALLEERDPLRGEGVDLAKRLAAIAQPASHPAAHPALERIAIAAKEVRRRVKAPETPDDRLSVGALAALAYPDRIGVRRKGDAPRFHLSGGKGAALPDGDALASASLIVAADLDGDQREAVVRLATPITRSELDDVSADRLRWVERCDWSKRTRSVEARRRLMLGEATLEDRVWKDAPAEALAQAMIDGVRQLGLQSLPWSRAADRFRARVARARAASPDLPDWSDAALLESLEDWLAPHLGARRSADALASLDVLEILRANLSWEQGQTLDRLAPSHFTAPTGTRAPIDYSDQTPRVAIRLQELFGVVEHPNVAGEPLLLDLLSPAQRPIQTTGDLPGFWSGSYADVRKDMRARYPKHPWPDDPTAAAPTRRAKPRGGGT